MEKSQGTGKGPKIVELKAGITYRWCSCGKSSTPPFCDEAHNCSDFEPTFYTPEKDETIKLCDRFYICNCGETKTPPYCDGTHKRFTR